MAELQEMLQELIDLHASDLYLKVGTVPHLRVDGQLVPSRFDRVEAARAEQMLFQLMPPPRAEEFAATGEADFAHSIAGLGRFRVHAYRQRGSLALVLRRVQPGLPSWERLGLPPVVERLAAEREGLIVVTGPAGSGKTTTVNALIDHVNRTRGAHIITVEDPIEFLHTDTRSLISQREVGTDTRSGPDAVRRALRQGPDVLSVGDLSDTEMARIVLSAAETGHLVFGTLTTTSAPETVARMIELFPTTEQTRARHSLSSSLRAVVTQRLLERADGKGRVPAVEVLMSTAKVVDAIRSPDREPALARIIAEGEYHGMQSFDQSLFGLFKEGLVSLRDTLAVASQPEDLRIALQQAGLSAVY